MAFKKGKSGNEKTVFKQGQTGNPNGRPKKLVSSILADLKDKGELVTRHMVTETYQVLMSLNEEQLKEITNDKEQPMINRIVAKEMLSKKGFDIIERMMDRANGKAMMISESMHNVEVTPELDLSKLTDDELRAYITIATKCKVVPSGTSKA
jgi:hypothetical protein